MGGHTWQLVKCLDLNPSSSAPGQPYLKFFDSRHGLWQTLVWPTTTTFMATADGGRTWHTQGSSAKQPVPWSDISFVNPSQGFLAEENSSSQPSFTVQETRDGGQRWVSVQRITGYWVQGISFVTPRQGWMLVENGSDEIWRTTDGGRSWRKLPLHLAGEESPSKTLTTNGTLSPLPGQNGVLLDFVNSRDGWFLTGDGLLRSEDGGLTWTRL